MKSESLITAKEIGSGFVLAGAAIYLVGAFVAWDFSWMDVENWTPGSRFSILSIWMTLGVLCGLGLSARRVF